MSYNIIVFVAYSVSTITLQDDKVKGKNIYLYLLVI